MGYKKENISLDRRLILVSALGCVLISIFLAVWVAQHNRALVALELAKAAEQLGEQIQARINLYQYGLRGTSGALATLNEADVSRRRYLKYFLTRDFDVEFPGARGFGFIRRVAPAQLDAFIAAVRREDWPNYTVRQLAPHTGELYLIQYIEPVDRNLAAVGLDIASEENRRSAAERALRTGKVQLTGPITLVQATGSPQQSFLILMPMYRGSVIPKTEVERMAAGYGWSYAPLLISEVLTGFHIDTSVLHVQLADVTEPQAPVVFFNSNANYQPSRSVALQIIEREVFGRKWQMNISATSGFVSQLHLLSPLWVLVLALAVSGLLVLLLRTLSLSRQRHRQIQSKQAQLAGIVESAQDAIIGKTLEGIVTSWNHRAEEMFGIFAREAIGKPMVNLVFPPHLVDEELRILSSVARGEYVPHFHTQRLRADKTILDVSVTASPVYNDQNELVGASTTIRDISKEKQAESEIINLNFNLEARVTERTLELEAALRENAALLDTLNQQMLFSVADPKGRIIEVNDNFCRVTGFSREELLGQDHRLLNSEVHSREFWTGLWHTMLSGHAWHGEICNRSKDGSLRWFDSVIAPFKDADGIIERFVSLRTDITKRKLIEQELTQTNNLLTNVLQSAKTFSIIAADTNGLITIFSAGSEQMLGYSAEEMVGKTTPIIIHDLDEVVARGKELSAEAGRPIEGFQIFVHKPDSVGEETREWTYIRKDGKRLNVIVSVTPLRDHDGNITGYLGIATDITERILQQQEIIVARDRLMVAAEVADLGVWTWNLAENSLQWNEQMFAIYEQPLELQKTGIQYEHWVSRIHPDDWENALDRLAELLEGQSTFDICYRLLLPGGRIRFIQAGAQVERNVHGEPIRVTGINIDITEQRELESYLRDAKHQADSANQAKSAFLANMSHEIRTPMNAVLGMLQLVRQTALTHRQQDYVVKAQSAAKSLLSLLNDILDFSKIDANKMELDNQEFDLEALFRELAIVLSGAQTNPQLEVLYDVDTALPRIFTADPLRLKQVLINLASNAMKFTSKGRVVIGARIVSTAANGQALRFEVSDTGIGIAPEQQARIFDGFVQAEASTTRRFGGTGLGLAISKRLVNMMGGDLQLESTLGEGSRFWFDLALPAAGDGLISLYRAHLPSELRILAVDESPLMSNILVNAFAAMAWRVDVVASSAEALTKAAAASVERQPYQIIFLDLMMPVKDVMATALNLRKQYPELSCPPILLLTAYGESLSEQGEGADAIADILSKPITPLQLIEAVARALGVNDSLPVFSAKNPLLNKIDGGLDTGVSTKPLTGLKLLVVEDNELNRQVAYELLVAEGASVSLAHGGVEGVARVTESRDVFDLVIMDVQMPDLDGLQATRRIRANERFRDLPIIAMTANASAKDRADCLAAGMNDHIGKPIDMEQLVPCILRSVRKTHDLSALGLLADDQPPYASDANAIAAANLLPSEKNSDNLVEPLDKILKRFGGNQQLLRATLGKLPASVGIHLNNLSAALAANDVELATISAHSIKGVAATLGATALSQSAAACESACKHLEDKPLAQVLNVELIADLSRQLTQSIQLIEQAMASGLAAPVNSSTEANDLTISAEQWRTRLAALLVLLRDDNLRAVDEAEALAAFGAPEFMPVADAVGQLNFQAAIPLVEQLLREH